MSTENRPFIALTALCDASARASVLTQSHGNAMERALEAVGSHGIAGLDLVELSLSAQVFSAFRKYLKLADDQVAMYDLFALSSNLKSDLRQTAGQFLAAEALWTLDAQGLLGGVPVHVSLDLPKGWDSDPKKVHARLVAENALTLSAEGITAFKSIKKAWDSLSQTA